ncbi:MAG: Ig-like domain-containing protein, partial [Bryobacteraceae bacterium]
MSPSGNDANTGTQARPFQTLEHARDAVRRLKQTSGVPPGGVSVFLRAGRYELAGSFTLTVEDSGREGSPIRYLAWGNERVTIGGGRAVTNFGPLTDAEALRRISPMYHTYSRQADLRALGITDFGKITP